MMRTLVIYTDEAKACEVEGGAFDALFEELTNEFSLVMLKDNPVTAVNIYPGSSFPAEKLTILSRVMKALEEDAANLLIEPIPDTVRNT